MNCGVNVSGANHRTLFLIMQQWCAEAQFGSKCPKGNGDFYLIRHYVQQMFHNFHESFRSSTYKSSNFVLPNSKYAWVITLNLSRKAKLKAALRLLEAILVTKSLNDSKQKHYFVQRRQLSVQVITVLLVVMSALSSRSSCVNSLSPCVHASIRHDKPSCKMRKPTVRHSKLKHIVIAWALSSNERPSFWFVKNMGDVLMLLEAKLIHQLHGKNKSKNEKHFTMLHHNVEGYLISLHVWLLLTTGPSKVRTPSVSSYGVNFVVSP